MNKSRIVILHILVLALCLSLVSCNNNKDVWKNIVPRNSFDAPFPKRNKDLSDILGKSLTLKMPARAGSDGDTETVKLKIALKDGLNLVSVENSGDTLFCGTVCKFKGLYYFSQKISDTAYWIFAVKRAGDKLYGINGMLIEGLKIDKEALSGKYPGLVKYISKDTSVIRLHADKKIIKKMLEKYVDSLSPYTILSMNNISDTVLSLKDTSKIVSEIDSDEFKLISKLYPNPATDIVNLEVSSILPPFQNLKQDEDLRMIQYKFTDISGKAIKVGYFNDFLCKIDVSDMPSGLYLLTVSTPGNLISESVKVLKK